MSGYSILEKTGRRGIERDRRLVQKPNGPPCCEKTCQPPPSGFAVRKVPCIKARKIEKAKGFKRGLRRFDILKAAIITLPEVHIFNDGKAWFYPVCVPDIVEDAFV